jgi:membrane protease YdiL (CAAX protease family)
MTVIKAFIKRHPVLTYFALVFAISWGGILIVVGPDGIPMTTGTFEAMPLLGLVAMLAGPSVAGLLMTGVVYGKAGFRELLSRLLRWRVGARWYAVALLTAPLLTTAVHLALSLFSREFRPDIFTAGDLAALLLFAMVAGLMVGFFEELGWTEFAVPMLRRRHGMLATGLVVGILWGAWHFFFSWKSDSFSGALPLALLLASLFSWLPAYRVLMGWVYDHTASLLVAVLMHASLVASMLVLMEPLALAGVPLLTSILVGATAWWIVVGAVVLANRGQISRQGKPPANVGSPQLTPR